MPSYTNRRARGGAIRTGDRRRLERHQRRIEELNLWRNALESPVGEWRFAAENGEVTKLSVGDFWPEAALPARFFAETTVPEAWAGSPVELELWLGGEGFVRLSTGVSGGLDPYHKSFPVTKKAEGGERVGVEAEVVPRGPFGTSVAEPRLGRAALVVPEAGLRDLQRDLALIAGVCDRLGDHEAVPHLLDVIEEAFAGLAPSWPTGTDVALTRYLQAFAETTDGGRWSLPPAPRDVEPLPEEARRAVRGVRATVAARLEGLKAEYPPVGRLALTGHAHLDLAWLWPVSETRRKGRRTFASVLSLMDRYDDFVFNQSSAQLYAWIEEEAPEIFDGVKRRVDEGRWEPVGGMWVEPDCQIPSGESIVRQLLYGQKYFRDKFGRRSRVAWLPDTFGFSPAVPQLLRGAGIGGFFTYKLNWSEANRFPHDLYEWEGLDGTVVTAHDFENPGQDYNGNITPKDVLGTWRNFEGKRRHPESLFSFGWGDGGGGPTEQMLENYARLKSFPAMPRLRMALVDEFFDGLPREGLPRWTGELYLELHRGTLTSQARVKKLNREAEHRLLEAEALLSLAALHGGEYPAEELEATWKAVLLNQFHDILPGTSIREVYEVTHRELEDAVETAERLRDGAFSPAQTGGPTLLLANASLNARPLSALLTGDERPEGGAVADAEGNPLPTQETEGGALLVHAPGREVPPLGWTVLRTGGGVPASPGETDVRVEGADGRTVLENALLRVEVGQDGALHRVYDKEVGREVLAGRANQLWAYTDRPRNWEAWDVEEGYEGEGEEVRSVESFEVVERGPLRAAVRVRRRWRGSSIVQTYRLLAGSRRLDVESRVGWHERRVLFRTLFPLNVRSHEVTCETMFGAQRRPTHGNTGWDAARFETSAHRFCDLSEPGYGVALMNDGKYGHSARGNVLGISLVRGPMYPDPLADEGEHRFTYSLFPHPGDWTGAGVTREALALNSPLVPLRAGGEWLPQEFCLVRVEGVELALGGLKAAEDGRGRILRLYEPHGARGRCRLRFPGGIHSAEKTNLLEDPGGEVLQVDGGEILLDVSPFEVVTLRVTPGTG